MEGCKILLCSLCRRRCTKEENLHLALGQRKKVERKSDLFLYCIVRGEEQSRLWLGRWVLTQSKSNKFEKDLVHIAFGMPHMHHHACTDDSDNSHIHHAPTY